MRKCPIPRDPTPCPIERTIRSPPLFAPVQQVRSGGAGGTASCRVSKGQSPLAPSPRQTHHPAPAAELLCCRFSNARSLSEGRKTPGGSLPGRENCAAPPFPPDWGQRSAVRPDRRSADPAGSPWGKPPSGFPRLAFYPAAALGRPPERSWYRSTLYPEKVGTLCNSSFSRSPSRCPLFSRR
jgi:hypothetical protein